MDRQTSLDRLLAQDRPWDMAVVGGGATGAGIAVDAASRGYAVCLLEQSDFGKGTSSRSTKLIHGGVRYLAWLNQRFHGDYRLVAAAYYAGEQVVGKHGLNYRNRDVVAYVCRVRAIYEQQQRASARKESIR